VALVVLLAGAGAFATTPPVASSAAAPAPGSEEKKPSDAGSAKSPVRPAKAASPSTSTATPSTDQGPKRPVSPATTRNTAYRVGAGDVLRIDVFDDATLSGDYSVSADRNIVFPLLGATKVGGSTVTEIKETLRALLQKDYLFDPNVSVVVKEFRSQKVSIIGNVGKPGTYFLEQATQIFDLLSKAEGISALQGDVRKGQSARIVRQESEGSEGATRNIVVDLYELMVLGKDEANVFLQDGDVVYVERSELVHVVGEVKRPGSYPYEDGMTVLKAVSLAGGATKKGSAKNTIIKRIRDGKEVRVKADEQDRIEPDDILEVPLSFW